MAPAKTARRTHAFRRHRDDWYVEQQWCSARLFAVADLTGTVLDPAAGFGRIVIAALAAGLEAAGSDIVPRWRRAAHYTPELERHFKVADFLAGGSAWPRRGIWKSPAVIASNPPFRRILDFYARAIALAQEAVILLLPWAWFCGADGLAAAQDVAAGRHRGARPERVDAIERRGLEPRRGLRGRQEFAWYEWRRGYRPRIHGGRPEIRAIRRDASEPAPPPNGGGAAPFIHLAE